MALVISSKAQNHKAAVELPNKTDDRNSGQVRYAIHPSAGGANRSVSSFSQFLEKQIVYQQNLNGLNATARNSNDFSIGNSKSGAPSVPIEGVFLTSTSSRYRFQIQSKLKNAHQNQAKSEERNNSASSLFDYEIDDMLMSRYNLEAALYSNYDDYKDRVKFFQNII